MSCMPNKIFRSLFSSDKTRIDREMKKIRKLEINRRIDQELNKRYAEIKQKFPKLNLRKSRLIGEEEILEIKQEVTNSLGNVELKIEIEGENNSRIYPDLSNTDQYHWEISPPCSSISFQTPSAPPCELENCSPDYQDTCDELSIPNLEKLVYNDNLQLTQDDKTFLTILQLFKYGNQKCDFIGFYKNMKGIAYIASPQKLDCLIVAAQVFYDEQKYEKVMEYFKECMKSLVQIASGRYSHKFLASFYMMMGDTFSRADQSLEEWKTAIGCYDLSSHYETDQREKVNLLQRKGECHNLLQDFQRALDTFEESLKLDPENTLSLKLKSNCLFNLGRNQESIKCYTELNHLVPTDAQVLIKRAEIYAWLEKSNEALVDCNKALSSNLNEIELKLLLRIKTISLMRLKRYDEALACCDEMMNLGDTTFHSLKADVYERQEKYQLAIEEADKFLKLNPREDNFEVINEYQDLKRAHHVKAKALLNQSMYKEALMSISRAYGIYKNVHRKAWNNQDTLNILEKEHIELVDNYVAILFKLEKHQEVSDLSWELYELKQKHYEKSVNIFTFGK